MLDLGGHFVVDDRLLVFADYIDSELEVILGLQLVGVRLSVLG